MKTIIVFFVIFSMAWLSQAQNCYHVIPYPNKLVEAEGVFEFKSSLTVTIPDVFKSEIELMTSIFTDEYYIKLLPSTNGKLVFRQNNRLDNEAYKLTVTKEKVVAEASSPTGCFWAFQTIRQLMKLTGSGSYIIATCEIEDQPAYFWRGFLLDESRNFKGKVAVKVLLDQMALMKMNVFHWHLTDDQGWRIEIKKFPLLTEVGAWRDSTHITTDETGWGGTDYDSHPHGGFYTQSEIKEIVAYAAKRHITIVPAINMPGHACAAIASYPWLGAIGDTLKVRSSVGDIGPGTLNVADDKVFEFIEDVLDEIMLLFPGNVIDTGGDEADYTPWENSNAANALMKAEGLQNFADIQMHFSNRLSDYLEKNGRRMMGYNEILGVNIHKGLWDREDATVRLNKNTIVHFWEGDPKQIKEAIEQGYYVVNSNRRYTYLNYPYSYVSLEKVYDFSPTPQDVSPEAGKHILGPEYPLWGERMYTLKDVYERTFPRLAAGAEAGWTNESNKDFGRFKQSLNELKRVWDFKGIVYYENY